MNSMPPTPQGISATRDELIEALTRLDVRVLTSGPAAGKVCAESMADAIIEALTEEPDPVHYRWPVVCGEPYFSGIRWSGNLDQVTCPACALSTKEGEPR